MLGNATHNADPPPRLLQNFHPFRQLTMTESLEEYDYVSPDGNSGKKLSTI